ncbi:hypothetical protein [Coprococcus phoceensis]|jgi:hypothetical protein|uniref:hypothetical protein n=1 Tax=Coprococcus phoceensis TaxID=1870993 RepID=UPI003562A858
MGYKQEAKKDCFAYRKVSGRMGGEKCTALKNLYCRYGECTFYKTQKEMCDKCKQGFCKIGCKECREMRRC